MTDKHPSRPDTRDALEAPKTNWELWRRDDNNNEFLISRHATQSEAQARADHFESLGHKQDYWVQPARP